MFYGEWGKVMTSKDLVLSCIPYGKENAIKKRELMSKTNLADRVLRQEIEDLRNDGIFICNNQDGKGYYITDDVDEIAKQYRADTARALSILKRRKYMRNYLKQKGQKV